MKPITFSIAALLLICPPSPAKFSKQPQRSDRPLDASQNRPQIKKPPESSNQKSTESHQAAAEKERRQPPTKDPDYQYWGLWVNCVLALATLIIGLFGAVQVRTTKSTAEKQLRAYLGVSTAGLKVRLGELEAEVHIKNFGQTPAYDVRHWIHKWVERHPLAITLPEPPEDLNTGKAIIGAGGESIMIGAWTMPPDLTLGTPDSTVYIYGKVTYKDIFGKDRYTRYRLMLGGSEPAAGTKPSQGQTVAEKLKPDQEGNEAT